MMNPFILLQLLFLISLEVRDVSPSSGLDWLMGRGNYDYDSPSAPEQEEPLFDSGPQYVAPLPAQQHPQPQAVYVGPSQQVPQQQRQQQQAFAFPPPQPQASVQSQTQFQPPLPQFPPQQPPHPAPPPPPPPAPPPPPRPQQQQHLPPPAQTIQQQPQQQQPLSQYQPQAHGPPGQPQQSQNQYPPHNQQVPNNPQFQQQQIQNRFPPRVPPEQEVVVRDNMLLGIDEDEEKEKDKPNPWLFGGEPPAPTFSPEDERIRQQKFMQQKTKWDQEEIDRQNQQHLKNREGEVVLNKAYVSRQELAEGTGKRIPNQVVVQTGGQHGLAPVNIAPVQPQPLLQQQQHQQPLQLNSNNQFQFQPDKDFVRPERFYEGKIRPDEGTKFLKETYGIPRRENRPRPVQAPVVAEETNISGGRRRSHVMDDPPAEIMKDIRWFDDDDAYDDEGGGSSSLRNITFNKIIVALILNALLN